MGRRALSWWRVVVDDDGEVIECRAVDRPRGDRRGIYYRLAPTEKSARKQAGRSHEAVMLAERRARYAAEGKCRCSRPLPDDAKKCAVCLEQDNAAKQRHLRRLAGEDVPKPDRREALAARRESDRAEIRREVLNEVLSACKRKRTIGALQEWLWYQLKKVTGRKEVA